MFETYLLPVRTAVTLFPLLALVVMLPVAVMSYRRRGRAGGWTTTVFYCFLFYLLAAFLQTIIPLPANPAEYCAEQTYASTPQLRPFYFWDVLETRARVSGTWLNPAMWSTALNVVLLAPLGFFVRYLSGVRFLGAAALGFVASLFFELTQLTGVWFIYPCAYRLFSVDDLILNTVGAVLGWLVAGPLIKILPELDSERDRSRYAARVTASRRVLALLTDGVAFGVLTVVVLGLLQLFGVPPAVRNPATAALAVLYFLLVPVQTGSTVGKRAMLMRIERTDGKRPGPFALLARNGVLLSPFWLTWVALSVDHWNVFSQPLQLLIPVGLVFSLLVVGVWTPLAVFFGDEPAPYERLSRTQNVAIVRTEPATTT
ncbi:VanZ family protein [Actinophytocola oryzae]|uniref:Glycopeptide antibiotics resistance protein n=1 Tax=Actinophytocola oryzae TaxID=502181 RepID=A0A4R7V8H8_9PSEU|nr:VanZ family protein [Actinophytocola oryzae]TDV44826.1 glycopeptide antibiotics resistance protein [Actinophytocola oryzae]